MSVRVPVPVGSLWGVVALSCASGLSAQGLRGAGSTACGAVGQGIGVNSIDQTGRGVAFTASPVRVVCVILD